jgi:predicted transcriptional regulator
VGKPLPMATIELFNDLIGQGFNNAEIARQLGITPAAVSLRKKRLKLRKTQTVSTRPRIAKMVVGELDSIAQLSKINHHANELLDALMEDHRNGENPQVPRDQALKTMAEIRGQLKLQLDIFQGLFDMKAAVMFQEEVLAAIAEVEPDVRDRIINRLQTKQALRQLIQPTR